jgi:hypothetical protein
MLARRKVVAASGLIAGSALLAVLAFRGESTPARANPGTSPAGSSQPSAAGGLVRIGASPLERQYDLKLESVVTVRGETILDYRLTAKWLVAGVEARGAEVLIRSQLAQAALHSTTARADEAEKLRAFEQTLDLPHFFTRDARGAVGETRLNRGMPTFVQSTLRWVIGAAQFVQANGDAGSWVTEELDASGQYRARYQSLEPGRFQKQKLEYLTPPTQSASSPLTAQNTQILESRSVFTLGPERVITALDAVERTRVANSGPLPEMTSSTKLTLRLIDSLPAGTRVAAKNLELEQTVTVKLSDPPPKNARRADVDRAKIGGRSLAQILTSLGAASGNDRDKVTKRARDYISLSALLRQDQKARADAVAKIERGEPDADLLIDALGDAGDPASQKALTGLVEKGSLEPQRTRGALIALSLVEEPSQATVSALQSKLEDPVLGTQATYGLGAFAHALESTDPERSRSVLDLLINRLKASTKVADIARYLEALGNAGHPGALPVIDAYLADPDNSIRAAALRALRRIPGSGVDQRLASAMTRDPASGVRDVAVGLVGQRSASPPLVEAVAASSRFEPVLEVRLDAVRILSRWLSHDAELVKIAQWLLGNDPNETIRATVRRALEARNG